MECQSSRDHCHSDSDCHSCRDCHHSSRDPIAIVPTITIRAPIAIVTTVATENTVEQEALPCCQQKCYLSIFRHKRQQCTHTDTYRHINLESQQPHACQTGMQGTDVSLTDNCAIPVSQPVPDTSDLPWAWRAT